jgi:hypothetical protein
VSLEHPHLVVEVVLSAESLHCQSEVDVGENGIVGASEDATDTLHEFS